jgi:dihydrofolate reductase
MEAPDKWAFQFADSEINKDVMSGIHQTEALLFGRQTYSEFAPVWPGRTGEMADRFNSIPKYVVSTTLSEATWNNTTIIRSNVAEEVSRVKEQPGELILINGSGDLVQSLQQDNLIDEYWLLVCPLLLGKGKRLFQEGTQAQLQLVESKTYKSGVVGLKYHPIKA